MSDREARRRWREAVTGGPEEAQRARGGKLLPVLHRIPACAWAPVEHRIPVAHWVNGPASLTVSNGAFVAVVRCGPGLPVALLDPHDLATFEWRGEWRLADVLPLAP